MARYYVRRGPYDLDQLQKLAAAGEITRDDAIISVDRVEWIPASNVDGLFSDPCQENPCADTAFVFGMLAIGAAFVGPVLCLLAVAMTVAFAAVGFVAALLRGGTGLASVFLGGMLALTAIPLAAWSTASDTAQQRAEQMADDELVVSGAPME